MKKIENLEVSEILDIVNNTADQYIVNIGCGNAVLDDPLAPLIKKNIGGLYIDQQQGHIENCKKNVNPLITAFQSHVTPDNIKTSFSTNNVPKDIDILKLDIDGYDLAVLKSILDEDYRPKIIMSEFNEKIPPQIHFDTFFSEDYVWDTSHFYGYSLLAGKDLEKYGYYIASLYDKNNILYIHKDYSDLFKITESADLDHIYKTQYLPHAFYYNKNVAHWAQIDDVTELSNAIISFFEGIGHNIDEYYINPNPRNDSE